MCNNLHTDALESRNISVLQENSFGHEIATVVEYKAATTAVISLTALLCYGSEGLSFAGSGECLRLILTRGDGILKWSI